MVRTAKAERLTYFSRRLHSPAELSLACFGLSAAIIDLV